MIYPKPYSIYLRRTINPASWVGQSEAFLGLGRARSRRAMMRVRRPDEDVVASEKGTQLEGMGSLWR